MSPLLLALLGSTVVPLSALPSSPEAAPVPAPIQASLAELAVAAELGEEVALRLTGTVVVHTPGPLQLDLGLSELTLGEVTVDGEVAGVVRDAAGRWALVASLPVGRHPLTLDGVIAAPTDTLALSTPLAPLALSIVTPGLSVSVEDGIPLSEAEIAVPPTGSLTMTWKPVGPPPVRPRRILAESALGLSVSEAGVEGRGVVRWQVLDGAVDSVSMRLDGPVERVAVTGAVVAGHTLTGEVLEVSLREPQSDRFSLAVDFSGPAPGALLTPTADRREGWVSVHLSDPLLLSRTEENLDRIAPWQVPEWGRDLVDGALLSSMHYGMAQPTQALKVQSLMTLESPGTVVDEAHVEVAYVAHGRAMGRAQYQVRNDRGAWLWIDLPADATVLAVQVAGHIAHPIRDGDRLGVPLEKSVETVSGLVRFPVEVAWLSAGPMWDEERSVSLSVPAVSAPVAHATCAIYLPPGASMIRARGSAQMVERWADRVDGLVYGRGYDREALGLPITGAPADIDHRRYRDQLKAEGEARRAVKAQMLWNQAYEFYKDNAFDQAKVLVEEALKHDRDHVASRALLGNLQALESTGTDSEHSRRIRAMARARSGEDIRTQAVLIERAEALNRSGDSDRAVLAYEDALAVATDLARLEDSDAYVQKAVVAQLSAALEVSWAEQEQRWAEEEGFAEEILVMLREQQALEAGLTAQADAVHRPAAGGMTREEALARRDALSGEIGDRIRTRQEIATTEADAAVVETITMDEAVVMTKEFLERIPSGRSYMSAVTLGSVRAASGTGNLTYTGWPLEGRSPFVGGGGFASSSIRSPRPRREFSYYLSADDPLTVPASEKLDEVTASRWIMLIPPVGEQLRFEQQLLAPGESISLTIRHQDE